MPKRRSTAESTPRIPTYRLHQATGQARCVIDGRTFYFGPFGETDGRAKYRRLIAEWVANGYRLPCSEEDRDMLTIAELCAAYWKDCKQRLPDENSRSSTKAALKVLRKHYGDTLASEFGASAVKALRHHLIQRGLLRRTVNFYMARLRQCFKWAMREELVEAVVYQKVAAVEALRFGHGGREAEPVRPVADEIIDATLPHLPAPVADAVRIQRLTGARPGEVRLLTWDAINRTGKVWHYKPSRHKTAHHGHKRIIFIGPEAQRILTKYLDRAPGAAIFSPRDAVGIKRETCQIEEVRKSKRGKRCVGEFYSKDSYRKAIDRACVAAGLPHWNPNRVRHTAATEVRKGYGLDGAQVLLGHSKVDTTQVYAAVNEELGNRIARRIG